MMGPAGHVRCKRLFAGASLLPLVVPIPLDEL
jgi:hypothetical protein